jgi:FMN reductase
VGGWPAAPPSHGLAERIDRAAEELAELVAGRPAARAADPFADAPSFEALLRGV